MLDLGGLPAPLRRYLLAVTIAGPVAVALLAAANPARPSGADALRAALLAAAAGSAAGFPLRFDHRTSLDVATAAYVAMILLFPPSVCGILALLAIAGAQLLRRSDPLEAAFNLGQGTLTVVAGALGFAAVRGLGAPRPQDDLVAGLGAVAAASAALHLANTGLVAGAVARQLAVRPARLWLGSVGDDLLAHAALTCLGVAAALLVADRPLALVLLVLPVGFVHAALRAVARQRTESQRHAAEQAALARASQAALSAQDPPAVLDEVARAALGVPAVDRCEIRLWRRGQDETEVVAEASVGDWPAAHRPGAREALAERPGLRAVLARREPFCFAVGDPALPAGDESRHLAPGVGSGVLVPLRLGAEGRGVLALYSRGRLDCPATGRFAEGLARQAAQAIERARLQDELRRLAETDALTGLLNRRAVLAAIEQEILRAGGLGAPVAVLLVDVDDLKRANDAHGHLAGDEVLRQVGAVLGATVRRGDRVGRCGGDEFLLVLPGTNAVGARCLAARIVERAAGLTVAVGEARLPLRVSVGAAAFPDDGASRERLVAAADAAMYAAKRAGGGRVGARLSGSLAGAERVPGLGEVGPHG